MEREQTTIRMPPDLMEALRQEAERRDISFSAMVNLLIFKGLELIHQGVL
jgi:hypothetical protein